MSDRLQQQLMQERMGEIRQEILWAEEVGMGEGWFRAFSECHASIEECEALRQMLIILRRKHRDDYSVLGNLIRRYAKTVENFAADFDEELIREMAENDLQAVE